MGTFKTVGADSRYFLSSLSFVTAETTRSFVFGSKYIRRFESGYEDIKFSISVEDDPSFGM